MKKNEQSPTWLFMLLLLCLALTIAAVQMHSRLPRYVTIVAGEAFVYPSGDVFIIALETGPYRIEGSLVDGCYRLDRPAAGAAYGVASYAGETCEEYR